MNTEQDLLNEAWTAINQVGLRANKFLEQFGKGMSILHSCNEIESKILKLKKDIQELAQKVEGIEKDES